MKNLIALHNRPNLKALGLMSGTSLDGLDLCLANFQHVGQEVRIMPLRFRSYPYAPETVALVRQTISGSTAQVCRANFSLGRLYVDSIRRFLADEHLDSRDIDLIGSHGQTVWHIDGDSTLQIGESALLAEAFGVPVIANFRVRDIAAGGRGAPLVPILDYYLFRESNANIMVLNIGGIANFTLVPAGAASVADIQALDTGPGNALTDAFARQITEGRQNCDLDGEIARRGTILPDVLQFLLGHPFIAAPPPKSTGTEVFGADLVAETIRLFQINPHQWPDLMATLTRFTAAAIHSNYQRFFSQHFPLDKIVISGGGVHNPVLMEHLQSLFGGVVFQRPEDFGIPADGKEALAFALLAALTVWGEAGNVPGGTGAKHPAILGQINFP